MLKLTFLGQPAIILDDTPVESFVSNKALAVFAYLIVEQGEHARDRLADLLWGETPERRARASLRVALHSVRQELADYLIVTRKTVAFDRSQLYRLDVEVLTRALDAPDGDPTALERAVASYRGAFLEGFYVSDAPAFEEWAVAQRERLRLRVLDALDRLVEHYLHAGYPMRAVEFARRFLEIEPLREELHRTLMRALARAGQYNEALRQYERCRQILEEHLGVAPMPETTALYERIKVARARPTRPDAQHQATVPATDERRETDEQRPSVALQEKQSGEDGEVPLVARDRELSQLEARLDRVMAGQGTVAFIAGEAGSGKTALVREFVRQAQERYDDLVAVVGHSTALTGVAEAYLPFREALCLLGGDLDATEMEATLSRENARRLLDGAAWVARMLVDAGPELVQHFLPASLLRSKCNRAALDGDQRERLRRLLNERRQRASLERPVLFSEYTHLLTEYTRRRPLVFLLEDLHWADTASLGLLFHLSSHLHGSRLLLIGTYRPEEVVGANDATHPLGEMVDELQRRHGDVHIDLDRASPARRRQFIDALLDLQKNRLDDTFRDALFRHTHGHALFTLELLRDMQERGALRTDEHGRWVAAPSVDWQTIPPRVEGVIARRIDRLPHDLRRALTVASVEGEEFTAEVIAHAQGVDETAMLRRLHDATERRHRIIREQGRRRIGATALSRYRFRHNLFRVYLYESLGNVERAYLHETVGTVLEQLYGERAGSIAAQLAHHFEAAGWFDKAVEYLLVAGQRAQRLAANAEAIDHLSCGLRLLERLPAGQARMEQELAFRVTLGHAEIATYGYTAERVLDTFRRAYTLCRQIDDTEYLPVVLYGLWTYYSIGGRYREALERGETMLREAHDPATRLVAHRTAMIPLFFMGRLEEAEEHLDYVVSTYDPAQHHELTYRFGLDPGVAAFILGAWMYILRGDVDRASVLEDRAFGILEAYPHAHSRGHALVFAGIAHQTAGHVEQVKRYADEAATIAKENELWPWLNAARVLQGWVLVVTAADVDAGFEKIHEGLAAMRMIGAETMCTQFLTVLVDAYCHTDRDDDTEISAHLDEVMTAIETHGGRMWESIVCRLRGELLRRRSDEDSLQAADAWFRRAIEVAQVQGARLLARRAALGLSRLLYARGDVDSARTLAAE